MAFLLDPGFMAFPLDPGFMAFPPRAVVNARGTCGSSWVMWPVGLAYSPPLVPGRVIVDNYPPGFRG